MNEMLERLDEAQRTQRRFVADSSHELRSPLATLAASLEVATTDTDGPVLARARPGHDRRGRPDGPAGRGPAAAGQGRRALDAAAGRGGRPGRPGRRRGASAAGLPAADRGAAASHPVRVTGRPRPARPGADQPGRQRGPARHVHGAADVARAARRRARSWSRTTDRECLRRNGIGCSSGSSGWTPAGAGPAVAAVWGWRSSARSCTPTAGTVRMTDRPTAVAAGSRSTLPAAPPTGAARPTGQPPSGASR